MDVEEATAAILYEAEALDGFLVRLQEEHVFDAEHWQRLWVAVSHLAAQNNGMFDIWVSFDLTRVISAVQACGRELAGRSYDSLDEFEQQILEANIFVNQMLAGL